MTTNGLCLNRSCWHSTKKQETITCHSFDSSQFQREIRERNRSVQVIITDSLQLLSRRQLRMERPNSTWLVVASGCGKSYSACLSMCGPPGRVWPRERASMPRYRRARSVRTRRKCQAERARAARRTRRGSEIDDAASIRWPYDSFIKQDRPLLLSTAKSPQLNSNTQGTISRPELSE